MQRGHMPGCRSAVELIDAAPRRRSDACARAAAQRRATLRRGRRGRSRGTRRHAGWRARTASARPASMSARRPMQRALLPRRNVPTTPVRPGPLHLQAKQAQRGGDDDGGAAPGACPVHLHAIGASRPAMKQRRHQPQGG
jgi:hypothetical protein